MPRIKRATPVDAEVGAKIRLRRLEVGMSQTALAEIVGVTFQQIQKYEKGSNRIGASRLQQIAQALDRPVSYFFGGDGKPSKEKGLIADFFAKHDGMRVMHLWVLLTVEQRRVALALMQAQSRQ
jgi:transcriptional regulator with XRE-family HTH domain